MIQTPSTASTYQANILAALQGTGITNTSPGAKARAFTDAVGDQIGQSESNSFTSIAQTLLPYATGSNLDFIGQMFGIPRLQASDVSASALDNNFEFYVSRGTFGTINNGQDITIPAGTQIYTAQGLSGQVVLTTNPVTCPASQSSAPFAVTNLQAASAGNAAAGVFTNSSFTNYADSAYGSLLVTNNYGLIGGRDAETDDDYRYRINLWIQSKGGAAEADLRLAVLVLPGIQDLDFVQQAGTFLCYVYGISPVVPPSLISLVQGTLDSITSYPLSGTATSPALVGISFSTTLTFVSSASSSDQQNAIANAMSAAQNYINNLAMGQEFVINELADQIQNSDPNILDIGSPDQPINAIFIWRSRDDGTRYSRYLVANYTPATGERIVVETSISNPIVLTSAS
jgi:hypothetical protein